MRYGLNILGLAVFSVLVLPFFADETTGKSFVLWSVSAAADSCVTTECHAVMGKAQYVHAPVAESDCSVCHKATDQPHPGENSVALVAEEPGLCLQCHESPAEGMTYPHSVLEEGCTGCHSPHQGSLAKFVYQPGGKLCLTCHEEVMSGEYAHGPLKVNNCQICHATHGGENKAMLNLPGNENCLACHAGIRTIMENAVSQHDPVANGNCWDCHTPHTSDARPFLKAFNAEGNYVSYTSENYALCFSCHDENAFLYEITSEATGFRNRHQNLHSFHVKRKEKGRVCRNCHGIHGAAQENLLTNSVPDFGQWDIPLIWASDGEKATCYVGCHRPKTYSQKNRIKNL